MQVEHEIRQLSPKIGEDASVLADAIAGEELVPLTAESFSNLRMAAKAISERAVSQVRVLMTQHRAALIRKIRIDDAGSWRFVAGTCYDAWPELRGTWWNPPSNQLVGMALCEVAAEFYGEDYMKEPWN